MLEELLPELSVEVLTQQQCTDTISRQDCRAVLTCHAGMLQDAAARRSSTFNSATMGTNGSSQGCTQDRQRRGDAHASGASDESRSMCLYHS